MDTYGIFMDESGSSDPKSYKVSPYFALCGVLINEKNGKKLDKEFRKLKVKYFKNEDFVLHSSDIRYHLNKNNKSLADFSKDLKKILTGCYFSLLYVVIDKEKVFKMGWTTVTIYKETYTILLANVLKFLTAKNLRGKIFAEASNATQDINLYEAFFHLIRRGIDRLSITNKDARKHLTHLCFVTKLNNDAEEQLTDLFGIYGRLKLELQKGKRNKQSLDPFENVIFEIAEKNLFKGTLAKDTKKIKLYRAINSFKLLP